MVSRPPVVRRFGPAHVAPPASLADAEWSFHREAEVEARPEAVAEQVGHEPTSAMAPTRGTRGPRTNDGGRSPRAIATASARRAIFSTRLMATALGESDPRRRPRRVDTPGDHLARQVRGTYRNGGRMCVGAACNLASST